MEDDFFLSSSSCIIKEAAWFLSSQIRSTWLSVKSSMLNVGDLKDNEFRGVAVGRSSGIELESS